MKLWLLLLCCAPPLSAALLPLESGEGRALSGEDTYSEALLQGLPLPFSKEELQALPAAQRVAARSALTRISLRRYLRAKAERYRFTPENEALCAQEAAADPDCPPAARAIWQALASPILSRRQGAALQAALSLCLENSGIDELRLRFFFSSAETSPDELEAFCAKLPVAAFFRQEDSENIPPQEAALQAGELLRCLTEINGIFGSIQDAQSAADAAAQLMPLCVRLNNCHPLMYSENANLLSAATAALPEGELPKATQNYLAERARLQDAAYYGQTELRLLCGLMD